MTVNFPTGALGITLILSTNRPINIAQYVTHTLGIQDVRPKINKLYHSRAQVRDFHVLRIFHFKKVLLTC